MLCCFPWVIFLSSSILHNWVNTVLLIVKCCLLKKVLFFKNLKVIDLSWVLRRAPSSLPAFVLSAFSSSSTGSSFAPSAPCSPGCGPFPAASASCLLSHHLLSSALSAAEVWLSHLRVPLILFFSSFVVYKGEFQKVHGKIWSPGERGLLQLLACHIGHYIPY